MKTPDWCHLTVVAIATVCIQLVDTALAPINPDNLDPNSVHVCSSNVNDYYTQLEYYQFYYRYKTNTWCWSVPPRCTQYLIKSEQRSRVVTKTRKRLSYFCCNGYHAVSGLSYCIPTCVDDCNSDVQQGTCVAPDTCICNHGFRGDFCESHCNLGTWGQDCQNTCHCDQRFGSCDPKNGNCICHIGYTGQECSQQCVGSFGLHCQYPCACENGASCSNINGRCTCLPGFYGTYCHKRCPEGTHGQGCLQTCGCQNGANCSGETGACVCNYGYTGEFCSIPCDVDDWGRDCAETCTCTNGAQCNSHTGECMCPMGYGGDSCQDECEAGYYGNDCQTECACENGGTCYYGSPGVVNCNCLETGYHGDICSQRYCAATEYREGTTCVECDCVWENALSCDPVTQQCSCKAGYQGGRCEDTCDWPYFGMGCTTICTCQHGTCDPVAGTCVTCDPGYTGVNCDVECVTGKWGLNCAHDCTCNNGASCDHKSGHCTCTPGWRDWNCDIPCAVGRYGNDCSANCTCDTTKSICNPIDGTCQCFSGYHGDLCTQCESMKFGFHCMSDCPCYLEGTSHCDHRTGECICRSGWKGMSCGSRCNDGTWGEGCSRSCACSDHGSCDQEDGTCNCYAGYIGDSCENTCSDGTFGLGCQESCPDCIDDAVCDFVTGVCPIPTTCPPGFMGEYCENMCPAGNYGPDCNDVCAPTCAPPQGICNPVSGDCHCYIGYDGTHCESECEEGYYGSRCLYTCVCVPENTQSCTHDRGYCHCKPGYSGDFCENECGSDAWGPECRFSCGDICENFVGCDPISGAPCACEAGYEGRHCHILISASVVEQNIGADTAGTGTDNTPTIIGIAVAAGILVILLLAIVVYYHRRMARLKNDNLQVQFDGRSSIMRDTTAMPNNDSALGVVNPMYESENRRNERQYPHLTSRLTVTLPRSECDADQDSCTPDTRPISNLYDDIDEDRYSTLKSVVAAPTTGESNGSYADVKDDLDKPNS